MEVEEKELEKVRDALIRKYGSVEISSVQRISPVTVFGKRAEYALDCNFRRKNDLIPRKEVLYSFKGKLYFYKEVLYYWDKLFGSNH